MFVGFGALCLAPVHLAARGGGGMGLASLGEWASVDFLGRLRLAVPKFLLRPFQFFLGGEGEFFLVYFMVCDSFY